MVNEQQKAFWSGQGGQNWVKKKATIDDMLSPFGIDAMKQLNLTSQSHVLDIGCGSGESTFQIAEYLSDTGSVTGIDISEPLLALANEQNKHNNVSFIHADMQKQELPSTVYTHAFSRFGVMFFENPIEAFQNINTALKTNGRLSFICWQSPQKNLWQTLVMKEVSAFISLPNTDSKAPGPFAFGDKSYIFDILSAAGFRNISIEAYEKDVVIFKNYSTEDAVKEMLLLNPSLDFLKEHPHEIQEKIKTAVTTAYDNYKVDNGFQFPSSAWMVLADK